MFAEDYESEMQEPSVKLREDVEAEWLPKVQKLEARAKERETFYKSLYDSVLELKSQKAQLKEVSREHSQSHPADTCPQRCQKLESICHEYIAIYEPSREDRLEYDPASGISASSSSSSPVMSTLSTFSSDDAFTTNQPSSKRITSVSMANVGSKLAMSNVGRNGGGLRSLKEDSVFDLAKRAALVETDDELF